MRDDVLQGEEDIIQRQTGLNPEGKTIAASSTADRTEIRRSLGPIRSSSTIERDRHFLTIFSLIP